MPWNYYILNQCCMDTPPQDWINLINKIKGIIPDKNINKIEAAAFCIKGQRTARWLMPPSHEEYCTKAEAYKIAKKLVFGILMSVNGPGITPIFNSDYPIAQYPQIPTLCMLCKSRLDFNDFSLDARKEPLSIQIGHDIPISTGPSNHNEQNISWIHRKCNDVKGEKSLIDTINWAKQILINNGHTVI